jgi:hypothetical protein
MLPAATAAGLLAVPVESALGITGRFLKDR